MNVAHDPWVWYWGSVIVLAALLFVPVRQLVWVMSVRRFERRTKRQLSDEERVGQRSRASFLALIVAIVFSALFNYQILGMGGLG